MCGKTISIIALVLALNLAANLQAQETFSLLPTFDTSVANDEQVGPNGAQGGTGMHMRNIPARRRVAFVTYDLSTVKSLGAQFSDVSLSNFGNSRGIVNVYGVLESQELLVMQGLNWNNAPGVENTPTAPLGSEVVLDTNDITDILLTFNAPARDIRESTETSEALAEFLNQDTNGFVALMLAPEGAANVIVRTVEMGPDGGTLLEGIIGGVAEQASQPLPEDSGGDVFRDQSLSWQAGAFAVTHDVYLGTRFDDVNAATRTAPLDVLVGQGQGDTSIDPGRLAFDQTYYWRVDEVNGAPDSTIFKGETWSFTTEPISIPITQVTATASSSFGSSGPEKTIDGSGLVDDLHGTSADDMWISTSLPATIEYAFDQAYRLHELWIWNSNQLIEVFVGFSAKDVVVEYSLDGGNWTVLEGVGPLDQAPGTEGYAHGNTIDLGGATAQHVRLTVNSAHGTIPQASLSEVRFFSIPTVATRPSPATGATDVAPDSVISWRPGREADHHQVFLGSDQGSVADGSAQSIVTQESSLDLFAQDLTLAQTYYLRVDEVNEAESPAVWPGEVWSFSLLDFLVVDDMESYRDAEFFEIWATWIDGFDDPANGSLVGNGATGSPETGIVNGGLQSMPIHFDAAGSVDRTFAPGQDWTRSGVQTLVIHFAGSEGTTGQMYAVINGTKVNYGGDAANLANADWRAWRIDLNGINNLQNVTSLGIGFDGAASGVVFIDDIELHP